MYGSTLDPLPLEVPMAIERCAPINEEPDPEVLQPLIVNAPLHPSLLLYMMIDHYIKV